MKKISFNEILIDAFDVNEVFLSEEYAIQKAIKNNPDVNRIKYAMMKACRKILESAAENVRSEYRMPRDGEDPAEMVRCGINKQSILDTIYQIEEEL